MPLPVNDPCARVVRSLPELLEVHKDSKVEVAFYPQLDTPDHMLKIFEDIISKDSTFNCYVSRLVETGLSKEYYIRASGGETFYKGRKIKTWKYTFSRYIKSLLGLSDRVIKAFIAWVINEIESHTKMLSALRVQEGGFVDKVIFCSLRASQEGARVALGPVDEYHQDEQNFTMMKFYVGPSTIYVPRKYLASVLKVSDMSRTYALEGQGVCMHKGKYMPNAKFYHKAPEGADSTNVRGFLTCWMNA